MNTKPVDMLVCYYPKEGKEQALLALILKHWPILKKAGLSTERKAEIFRACDIKSGEVYFVESFQWKDSGSSDIAHQTPEVMAVWEPMGDVLQKMTLTQVDRVETNF